MTRTIIDDGQGGCIFVEETDDGGVLLYLSDDPTEVDSPDLIPTMGLTLEAVGRLRYYFKTREYCVTE